MTSRSRMARVGAGLLLWTLAGVARAQATPAAGRMERPKRQTAERAFAASPKGTPDPSWKGKTFTIATPASGPWNTVWGFTGVNPGTKHDFFPPLGTARVQDYTAAGYDRRDAIDYLNAGQEQEFKYPQQLPYLRIPGTPSYLEALDVHLSEALSGQVSAQEALDRVASDWNRIADRLGRDAQRESYQEAIGYRGQAAGQ